MTHAATSEFGLDPVHPSSLKLLHTGPVGHQPHDAIRDVHLVRVPAHLAELVEAIITADGNGQSVTVILDAYLGTVLSSEQTATMLNVSRPHVVALAKRGELRCTMVGNRHRFYLRDVLAYEGAARSRSAAALQALVPDGGYAEGDF